MRRHLQLRYLGVPIALFMSLGIDAAAQAQPSAPAVTLRLFVSDYEIAGADDVDAVTANQILATRMGRLGTQFQFVTKEDVRQVLDQQALVQLLGAENDSAALIQLGESIAADRLIHGRLSKVGETSVATLTLYDLSTGVVEKRIAGTFRGAVDLAITRLNEQADQMLAYLLMSYAIDKVDKGRRVAIKMRPQQDRLAASSGPGWLGAVGAATVGLGTGLAVGGVATQLVQSDAQQLWLPVTFYAVGGVAIVAGATLLLWPDAD